MPFSRLLSAAIAAMLALPAIVHADDRPVATASAVSPWQFEWNARLRQEAVDDGAFARDASATTLRLRAGVRWHGAAGFSALIEGEGIAAAGDRYNSGANGNADRPAITDPVGAELNQADVAWKGARAGATLGRQRLQFDNQRWIGNSGWRQNEQTFDAAAMQWSITPAMTMRYAYLDRAHRVNGADAIDPLARERDLSTHAFNLAWKHAADTVAGYAYLHQDRDVASASTRTIGARWTGTLLQKGNGWGWTLDVARQQAYADNPLAFTHAYWLVEPTYAIHHVTWRAGWEHLGGNGAHALQAPLSSLHAFNGWADKFLVTPPGGLDDRYVGSGGVFGSGRHAGKFNWQVAWHDFRADNGDRYGAEWDASLGFPLAESLIGLVKVADYRSDGYARDTRKLWFQMEWTR